MIKSPRKFVRASAVAVLAGSLASALLLSTGPVAGASPARAARETGVNALRLNVAPGHLPHLFLQQPTTRQKIGTPYKQAAATPLTYKAGGVVMAAAPHVFLIFWEPPKLQNGQSVAVSAGYNTLIERYFRDVGGHSIYNNNTQYYETVNGVTSFIQNGLTLAAAVVDTTPFPAADCHDPAFVASNCISDAVIQAEIKKEAAAHGWKPGIGNLFFVYTQNGEGSCQAKGATTAANCFAPGGYCAYHGFINTTGTVGGSFIYGNMPYDGDAAKGCGILSGSGTPVSPNNNVPADVEISVTSHENMEAVTDPFPGTALWAWHDSSGAEIGDKCAGNPGPGPYWDNDHATQFWNGHFYVMQSEFDNHTLGCEDVGP
jgi:hypothetical protein